MPALSGPPVPRNAGSTDQKAGSCADDLLPLPLVPLGIIPQAGRAWDSAAVTPTLGGRMLVLLKEWSICVWAIPGATKGNWDY